MGWFTVFSFEFGTSGTLRIKPIDAVKAEGIDDALAQGRERNPSYDIRVQRVITVLELERAWQLMRRHDHCWTKPEFIDFMSMPAYDAKGAKR